MSSYGKRFFIVCVLAICIGLLFLGGRKADARAQLASKSWVWPCSGVISDYFGTRNGKHKGIDIAGSLNDPIKSVDKGYVTKSYYSATYGNVVFIKHDGQKETVYAHLHKRMVQEGESVSKDQIIGLMGNTGQSSGVHLHFEVHQKEWTYSKENALDPLKIMAQLDADGEVVTTASKEVQIISDDGHQKVEATSTQMSNNPTLYKVKKGDTLWSIANSFQVSVQDLIQVNNLKRNGDDIKAEQVLKILTP